MLIFSIFNRIFVVTIILVARSVSSQRMSLVELRESPAQRLLKCF